MAKLLMNSRVGAVVLWQVSDWRPGLSVSIKHLKVLFTFGFSIVGSIFVDFFNRYSDDLFIGYFSGPTVLGYYALPYSLLLTMTNLLSSVPNAAAFPVFFLLQNELARMRITFYEAIRLASAIAFPVFLGISILASEVEPALYGPK